MPQCENNIPSSVMAGNCRAWIAQRQCPNKAKHKITRLHQYLNGGSSTSTRNVCGRCARRDLEYRFKLDNHIFYNDDTLDHTYPIIETLTKVEV